MSEAKRQRDIDNAHRALGHYIAEFSQLIAYMRRYTALGLSGVPERGWAKSRSASCMHSP